MAVILTCIFAACNKVGAQEKTFTITFDSMGGSNVPSITIKDGETFVMPANPTKSGYIFAGWYLDASYVELFEEGISINGNLTLYAKWKVPEPVEGTQAIFKDFSEISAVEYSTKVANTTTFIDLSDYVTVNSESSWALSTDIYGNQTIASKTATLNLGDNIYYVVVTAKSGATQLYTLRIRRRPVFTVSFDTVGGTSIDDQIVEEDSLVQAPVTTKEGYSFVSWNFDFSKPITEDKILMASWTANTYKITFNVNGGEMEETSADVVFDEKVTFNIPTKRGYDFVGWYYNNTLVEDGNWKIPSDVTLDAKWTATVYTISFDLGGGYFDSTVPTAYTVEDNGITIPAATRPGYTFVGWTGTDITTQTREITISSNSIGNREYVANWTLDSYTITYILNGGTNSSNNPETYNVTSDTITLENPTRVGYVFGGWFTTAEFATESKLATILSGSTGNVTVYAKWTPIEYSVVFNKNSEYATGTIEDQTFVYDTAQNLSVNTFERTGYTFDGWNTKADGSGTSYADSETVNNLTTENEATITFYAQWKANTYTITYNANGGEIASTTTEVVFGASFTLNTITKRGYNFDGWYYGDTVVTDGIWDIASDVALDARWTVITYTISYNLDGGEVSTANPNAYTVASTDITLVTPARLGYTFIGWTGTDLSEPTITVTIRSNSIGNREYVANWTLDSYKITYILNGGTNSSNNPETYNVTSDTITFENPTRVGYIFGGWFTAAEFATESKLATILSGSTGNVTVYAKWIPIAYSVVFNKNSEYATGRMGDQAFAYDTAQNLSVNAFERTGYTFDGWNTKADGSGTSYADSETVNNLTIENGATITFYAQWKANSYAVLFDKTGGESGTESVNAFYDSDMPAATAPRYDGYGFAGYFDADGVQYYDSEMNSVRVWDKTKDATLYARWEGKTFTVTFDKENGIEGTSSVAAVFNENMPSASAPSRVGYIFKGYFDERNGAGTQYYSEDMTSVSKWNKSSAATLYAYWEARTYTVSFDYNGGNGNNDDVISTYDSAMPTINGIPTRNGYIFTGYFDAINGGKKYYNADLTSAKAWDKVENTTLYAQWIGVNYFVIFDGNGNTSETMENQSFVYGTSQNLNKNLFVRTGYTFKGWNTEADGRGTNYSNCASVNNLTTEHNGTVVLYAQWIANTYRVSLDGTTTTVGKTFTVSFNLNGALGTAPSAQTVNNSVGLIYPNIPTRSGYIFGGWYTTSSCSGNPYNFASEVTSDVTLYAKWVQPNSFTGILSMNGSTGSISYGQSIKYYAFVSLVDQTITLYTTHTSGDPKIYLYNASKSELASNDDSNNRGNSDSEIKYNVKAGVLYYVGFGCYSSSNGTGRLYLVGSATPSAGGKTVGSTTIGITADVTFGSSFTLSTDISRTGYSFAGWYDGIDGTGTQYTDADGYSVRVWDKAENTTLYAKWNVNQYTISFVSNGGSTVDAITQDYGSTVLEPTKPSWVEKSFVGWFTDSSLTNEYRFTTMPAENITLYAKWIEYTVSLASDETTEISINSTVTSAESYNATAIDTDGNPVNVVVTLIGGTFEAGKNITVRLVATGLYDVYATKTISNIKVYGIPSLEYNTEKDYFNLTDTIDATLWSAIATDTFGGTLNVSVSVKESNYSAGDRVTIVISATDITGNESKVEIANVKVYGAPVITRNTDKNDMKATDTVGNEIFGVSAVDSFGEPLTVLTEILSGTIAGGNTIIVKSSAIDSKGNTDYITYSIKVYGLPTISDASKTSFKVDDTISLATLGIVVKDSFNQTLSDVTLALSEGEQTAGQTLTFIVTATDHLGNIQTKTISGIRIYGTPTISFDTAKNAMSVTDDINASLFSAVAKDSHGGDLSIDVTLESGTLAGGSIVTFRLSTKDALGNEYSVVTQNVKVYSSDSIVLTYNVAASSRIKKISKGEEFGASAVDGFGENCTITIEAADGYTIAGGKVINLYIVATDALGNTTRSELITNIKVYDTPTLKYTKDYPYIQNGDSPYALYLMTDSFGEEILFDVVVVSGSLDVNETIVYRISGKDRAGNLLEETRELVVLDTDESILELYKNGVKIGTQRVYKGSSYTLPKESNSNVAWHLGSLVLTDDNGASRVAWDKDSGGYIITTEYYTVSYNANGGNVDVTSQLVNVDASYTNPVPTRVGYTFLGWYSADGTKYTDGIWTTTSDVVLTAKWVANTDTAYVVNHYQQNIEDDEYTLFEQENLTGTSDVKVTPTVKKYVGFTSPYAKNVTIAPDGSLVVNYYYKRNYYTIKVVGNGGSDYSVRLKYDTPIDPMSWTSRDGYTLGGYYSDLSMTELYTDTTVGAQNITIYAFWIGDAYYSDFTYTSSTSGVTITGYTGASPIVKVPEQINGQTVVSIASSAFAYNTNIRSINIPDTVENIAEGAFKGCSSLESMTIPFVGISKTASESYQLFGCIFGRSSYDGGVATKQYYEYSSYSTYYIPSSLKSVTVTGGKLSYGAFYNCTNLSNVTIGSGVTSIGYYAFYDCSRLMSVTIGSGVTSIGYWTFCGCSRLMSVTIGSGVTSIGDWTFCGCSRLTSVTIPNNVTSIGYRAFDDCSGLTSVTIGNSVTRIDYSAFSGCSSLETITIPFVGSKAGVTSSDTYQYPFGYIFGEDSYTGGVATNQEYYGSNTSSTTSTTYYIPSSLKSVTVTGGNILYGAFYNCSSLTNITIPDTMTSIGGAAFYGCSGLTSVTIPDSVTSIGWYAFSGCSSLETMTIPFVGAKAGVTSSDTYQYPFGYIFGTNSYTGGVATKQYYYGSSTSSTTSNTYYIPSSLKSVTVTGGNILYGAFYNCRRLTSIIIPDGVTSIGAEAFWECTGLTSITIPDSVTSIGRDAFYDCYNRRDIYITDISAWCNISGLNYLMKYGSSNKKLYINNELATSVTIPDGVKAISSYAFSGCTGLTSVTIPASVTRIDSYAFYNCSDLKTVFYAGTEEQWKTISIGSDNDSLTGATRIYNSDGIERTFSFVTNCEQTVDSQTAYNLSKLPELKRDGYAFLGWYDNAQFEGEAIAAPYFSKDKTILYARWSALTYSINYVLDGWTNSEQNVTSYNVTDGIIPLYDASKGNELFCGWYTDPEFKNYIESIDSSLLKNYTLYTPSYGATKGLTIENGAVMSYSGDLTDVVIPAYYRGKEVSSIVGGVFSGRTDLISVTIGKNVTSIDIYAFTDCNLTTINWNATAYLSATSSKYSVFKDCPALTTVNIGDNVESVPFYAFYGCSSLTNVTIGIGVTSIGGYVFDGCRKLETINWNAKACTRIGTSDSVAFKDCSALKTVNIGPDVEFIPAYAFKRCNSLTTVNWNAIACTSAGSANRPIFEDCSNLTMVNIGDKVESIPDYTFYGCSGLTNVTIPNSVTSIGNYAFKACAKLQSVNWNAIACTSAGSANRPIFEDCPNLTTMYIGDKVTTIPSYAFYDYSGCQNIYVSDIAVWCNISGLDTLMSSPRTIYIGGKKIEGNLIIPSSVTRISDSAFMNCNELTSVVIENGTTSIGFNAFKDCSNLMSITIPDSVTSIHAQAFCGCSALKNVIIPDSVTYMGDAAFQNCSGLTSVAIGNGLTSIGRMAFLECSGLISLTIGCGVTNIDEYAFYGCIGLTSMTIPSSVTSLGPGAFQGCSGLTSITIPDSVTTISSAFSGCRGLTSVAIPSSVTSIEYNAFGGCSGLTSITIPNSVTSIGSYAFSGCSGLTSVTIPDSVTSIGEEAFKGCSGLTSITIPDSVKDIGTGVFKDCTGLASVIIGNSVTSISGETFANCTRLTSVTFGNSVTSIDSYAFSGCTGLMNINFKGTTAQWTAITKSGWWDYETGSYIVHCTDGDITK